MGLRPGRCYNSKKDRANTRLAVRVHRKNYIGAAPGLKTRQFNMGNPTKPYTHIVELAIDDHAQIRDNSIESFRTMVNRYLVNNIGKDSFFIKIRIYPHHLLRENKQAQGAHADRIQTGMSHSFGKTIGRAARVRPNQKIVSVLVVEEDVKTAKEALRRAKSRLTGNCQVISGTDVKSIGTLPRKFKIKEEKKKEEKEEETKEGEEGKGDKKDAGKDDKKDAGKDEKGKKKDSKGKK